MIANFSTLLVTLVTLGSDGQLQAGTDGIVYSPQRAFRVPLELSERDRREITAVRLFVSEDQGATWMCHSDGSPETTAITFRSKRDGTFWFTLAYVQKDGTQSPPEVKAVEPGLKVCVDTKEPALKLSAIKSSKGRRGVKWELADENLDPVSMRLAVWREASGWEPMNVAGPDKNKATLFFDDQNVRKIQAIVKDRAGNKIVEQLEVDGDQFSRQSMSSFVLDDKRIPSSRMPNDTMLASRDSNQVRRMSWDEPASAARTTPKASGDYSMSAKPSDSSIPTPPSKMNDFSPPRMNESSMPARTNESTPSWGGRDASRDFSPARSGDMPSTRAGDNFGARSGEMTPSRLNESAPPARNNETTPAWGGREAPRDLSAKDSSRDADNSSRWGNASQPARRDEASSTPKPANDFFSPNNRNAAPTNRSMDEQTRQRFDDWGPTASKQRVPQSPTRPSAEKLPLFGGTSMIVQYEVDRSNGGSPARVELWGTRDRGANWEKLADDPDQTPPIEARMRPGQDGIWGLKILCTANGARAEVPQPGSEPDTYVEIDVTPPAIAMKDPVVDRGQVQLHWTARDTHLGTAPIRILYSTSPQGPWNVIADKLDNTGEFIWNFARDGVTGSCMIRIDAKDEAGNVGSCESIREVNLGGSSAPARGKVLGVQQRSSEGNRSW